MKLLVLVTVSATALVTMASPSITVAAPAPGPAPVGPSAGPHRHSSVRTPLAAPHGPRAATGFRPFTTECSVSGGGPNLNLDCDDRVMANNEPHIAVDPADPKHLVASSNDFESPLPPDQFYTSFDGGRNWKTGNVSGEDVPYFGSDPSTSFDVRHKRVLHASMNFRNTANGRDDADVVVSPSSDGGRTWQAPVIVYGGQGNADSPTQVINDKPWIVTDNNPSSRWYGRTYVTWSRFLFLNDDYAESPIWMAFSDDGGRDWSSAKEISGSDRTCSFQETGAATECDQDQGSVPVVGPDGTLSVAFQNEQHEAAWEQGEQFDTQYLVVRSRDGGRTFSTPASVIDLEDGDRDYPTNVNGDATLTDFQARLNSLGNIGVNPKTGELGLVFSDNRAGQHDVANPVTNTNVYLMTSTNGRDWRGPHRVASGPEDQWFPWLDVNPRTGKFGVLFHQEDSRRARYLTRLATGTPASGFSTTTVSTEASNSFDSVFRPAGAAAGECAKCTTFFGDYISLDYGSDGTAHMVWTDMRREVTVGGVSGHTENIFYARR